MGWLIAIGIATLGVSIWSAIDSSNSNAAQLELQQQELYNNANESLLGMQSDYATVSTQIQQNESDISSYEDYISRWQEDYDAQVASSNLEINTYDDYLANWQTSYDSQVSSAQSEGKSNFQSLMANWSDAEVLAADRGMGGSMTLVANQEKQKVVDYVGSDLSTEGSDGVYGLALTDLQTSLNTSKTQAEETLGVLNSNLDVLKQNLTADLATNQNNLDVAKSTLKTNQSTLSTLDSSITDQQTLVDKLKKEAGL